MAIRIQASTYEYTNANYIHTYVCMYIYMYVMSIHIDI